MPNFAGSWQALADLGLAGHLNGQGTVLQLPDIQRQRIGGGLLTGRSVSAPSCWVLKHLSLAPVAAKLCTCMPLFTSHWYCPAFSRLVAISIYSSGKRIFLSAQGSSSCWLG